MFGNDMMTARVIFTDATFSIFNFAVLKDTGWYDEVNYDLADPMVWGKDAGCLFLEGTCPELANADFHEFHINTGPG